LFIIDDIINAIGASQAAGQQERAAKEAMGLQRELWDPYINAGTSSLGDLMGLTRDPSAINASPAYQFRLAEGNKALERSAAARGGLNSGGFMKGMARYSQGLASDEYGNQWNRLMGLSQMGQNSASNFGNNMANLYGAQGNAQAAGTMGIANGISGSIGSLGNLAMLGMGGAIPGITGLGGSKLWGANPTPSPYGAIPRQGGG